MERNDYFVRVWAHGHYLSDYNSDRFISYWNNHLQRAMPFLKRCSLGHSER
jgi:hypothetical protein